MNPTLRRSVEAIFDEYGRNIAMRSDENAHPTKLTIAGEYGERPTLVGTPANIALAMDVRDGALVPEAYSDEASTWA